MRFIFFIFLIQSISGENCVVLNDTLRELNEMEYSHESEIIGHEADFSFTIVNVTYARSILGIDSYYYSITYLGEERHEERLCVENITTNTTEYHGLLKMKNLEEEGNYFICVMFLNGRTLIASSRFCHVVSVHNKCDLEVSEGTFSNQHVFVLLGFVGILMIIIVVVTTIRRYIYRPKTIEDYLKIFSEHHRDKLEALAPVADERRRRQTQPALGNRLREDSVLSIHYNPNADNEYLNYHGIDNASLDTLTE